jgi:hypothetical protein
MGSMPSRSTLTGTAWSVSAEPSAPGRTVGRGVRIERRPFARIGGQGWNGAECAALLEGVVQPMWRSAVSWRDDAEAIMWRADETDLLPGAPVQPGGVLTGDPGLTREWWKALNSSLDALAAHHTVRTATPDTVTISQAHVDEVIRSAFPEPLDALVQQWTPAHADLNWATTTGDSHRMSRDPRPEASAPPW